MGRARIEFPFNFGGSYLLTGNWKFTGNVTFVAPGVVNFDGVTNLNGNTTYTGAQTYNVQPLYTQGARFEGGSPDGIQIGLGTLTNTEFGPFSTTTVDSGASFIFNNIPVFNLGIRFSPGGPIFEYVGNTAFTPIPNGFTIVNGTGGVTFTGIYTQIGKFMHYEIQATLTGNATLAAVLLTSFFTGIPAASLSYLVPNHACDNNGTNYGHGVTLTEHFSPTIAATHGNGFIVWTCDMLVP